MGKETTHGLVKIPTESLKLLVSASITSALRVCSINFSSTAPTWPAVNSLPDVCRRLYDNCLTNASVYLLNMLTAVANNRIGGGLAIIESIFLVLLPSECLSSEQHKAFDIKTLRQCAN
jgi:hypothetical protein